MKKIILLFFILISQNSYSMFKNSYINSSYIYYTIDSACNAGTSTYASMYSEYNVSYSGNTLDTVASTDTYTCNFIADHPVYSDTYTIYLTQIAYDNKSCTSPYEYLDNSCSIPAAAVCPSAGTDRDITYCSPLFPSDSDPSSGTIGINGGGGSTVSDSEGCTYTATPDSWYDNSAYKGLSADGTPVHCMTQSYRSTGLSGDIPTLEYEQGYTDDTNPDSIDNAIHDYYKNVDPDSLTNNPDGSSDLTQSENSGVDYGDTFTQDRDTFTESTGGGSAETKTTDTHTNPDGSSTVTTNSTGSSTTPTRIFGSKALGSYTSSPGSTTGFSSSSTSTYDSNGNLTGSTTSDSNPIDSVLPQNPNDTTDDNAYDECDTAEENCEDFSEILGDLPETNAEKDGIDSQLATTEGELDDFIISIDEEHVFTTTLDSTFLSLVPDGACSDVVLDLPNGHVFTLTCSSMSLTRDVLGFLLYVLTAFFLLQLVITPVRAK